MLRGRRLPESATFFPSSDTGILEPLLDIASLKRINQLAHLAAEKSVE
jgi:hypothetical protein